MPNFSLNAFIVWLAGAIGMTSGGAWGLVATEGHPAFLAPIAFGLFFIYLAYLIFFEDWLPRTRGKSGSR